MASYYVKNAGGTGTGLDDANAWSLSHYNAGYNSLTAAGDTVYFNRGEVYQGVLNTRSGSIGSVINYDAYGIGADPIFTGLTTLSSWTLHSGNIYYATLDVARLQVVTVDGVMKGMGRYPNSGYLVYTSHSGNASITGTDVGTIPFDPAGAEVVIKKYRYVIDRHIITSRSSNTLNYSTSTDFGASNSYNPTDGNGFFIQGHLSCLTEDGDWYYDNAANRLYMYFTATPSGRVVKASSIQTVADMNSKSYISVANIETEGGNINGFNVEYADHITLTNCTAKKTSVGVKSLQGGGYLVFNNVQTDDCLSNGIFGEYETDNTTVYSCVHTNTQIIPGMGRSGDASGSAISLNGNNLSVTYCNVSNVGYNGIAWYGGSNVLVEKNKIDTYCTIKDDGGGIYTFGNFSQTFTNRIVRNNIILNGIGSTDGAGFYSSYQNYGAVFGVYLDQFASQVTVEDNFVDSSDGAGIFIHDIGNSTLTGNLLYDCRYGLQLVNTTFGLRGISFNNNTIIAKTATQYVINVESYQALSDIANFGTFNNNVYARPISEGATIQLDNRTSGQVITHISPATWASTYSQDADSTISAVTITDEDEFRVDYNDTDSSVDIPLTGIWKDVSGNTDTTPLTLPAYQGQVLTYFGPSPTSKILVSPTGKIWVNSAGKILTT